MMKITILFLSLLFTFTDLSAQNNIKGKVADKDTQLPVPDVIVQYGGSSKDYIYTDKDGIFSIPESSEDIIHFQCIGYKAKSVLKTNLRQHSIVILELNPVSLNPIVISPGDADALLEEVMINTKKKLFTDLPVGYLLHFLQTKTSDSLQNEIYLKYTTTLNAKDLKKDLKKERVPYIYNIVDIKRLQRTQTPTSELYGAEYHASHLFTFGKSINNETTRTYTSDSSLIILQIEPLAGKEGWASGEIRINKEDMTIAAMEIESVDSLLEKQPYKKYMGKDIKILRKVGRFGFAKANGRYYMKECYTYYKFRTINEYGKEDDIVYYCDVKCIGAIDKMKIKKRRLSGFCQELFYFPDSTQDEFWLDNPDSGVSLQEYYFSGEHALGDNSAKSKNFFGFLRKNAIYIVPFVGLLILTQ